MKKKDTFLLDLSGITPEQEDLLADQLAQIVVSQFLKLFGQKQKNYNFLSNAIFPAIKASFFARVHPLSCFSLFIAFWSDSTSSV